MSVDPLQVESIFSAALERPAAAERAAFLDMACGSDRELRERVESLLAAHDASDSFLALPEGKTGPESHETPSPLKERPGTCVGRYRLLEEIGEGGFGTVFMAEQTEPVRRRVALKVIKLGMDTRQVVARFEAERQALAMMDHSSIAKVLDGGATETGRPYFVMEMVKGTPITEYCDRHNLSVAARLELFLQVCQAVQHAHQKGVIHRDLKPSNVLVSTQDDRPLAKVIDFGIAKATQARLTEKTLFTEFHQVVGTPQYMSPEQCGGHLDVDTRSDIYSLGVLLYELLTGSTPFDAKELRSKAFAEMQRIIREVEPPTPSIRLSSSKENLAAVAAQRGTEPRKLNAELRGELDWIVMKALEKDRARRYESASFLAADVMHYLADEPVDAGPPSRRYRLRKFTRRHRGPVIACLTVLVVLVAGVIGTTVGLIGQAHQRSLAEAERAEARKQEKAARSQALIARAVGDFLSEMLASADPGKLLGDKVTVVQAVQAALTELESGKLEGQPLVEASVRDTIGETLQALGRFDEAEKDLLRALEIRRSLQGLHLDTAATLNRLARVLEEKGDFGGAERLLHESLEIRRDAAPGGDPSAMYSLYGLAIVQRDLGKYAEAERFCRDALAGFRKALPAGHADTAHCLALLGFLLQAQGKFTEAEPFHREGIAMLRKALPEGHPDLAEDLTAFYPVLLQQGKTSEAESVLREALDVRKKTLPEGHKSIAASLNNLAAHLTREGRFAEGESLLRQAVEINRRALPPGHPDLAGDLGNLAFALENLNKLADAEAFYREALEMDRKALPPGHANIAKDLGNLARLLTHVGKLAEAESAAREAIAIMRQAVPAGHPDIATCLEKLSSVLRLERKLADAEPLIREALEIRRKALPPGHPGISASLHELADFLSSQGKLTEALPHFREALEIRRKAFPPGHPAVVQSLGALAGALQDLGNAAEAEPLLRETLAILEGGAPVQAARLGITHCRLGRALVTLQHSAEAEQELLEGERILATEKSAPPQFYRGCVADLVSLYERLDKAEPGHGHDAAARLWKSKLPASEPKDPPAVVPAGNEKSPR